MKSRAERRTFPPRWFNLSKYKGIEGFGPSQWHHHLLVRIHFADVFRGLYNASYELDETKRAAEENLLSSLRQKPLHLADEMESLYRGAPPDDYDERQAFAG